MAEPYPPLSGAQVLDLLPQQEPFRFVDEVLEIGDDGWALIRPGTDR